MNQTQLDELTKLDEDLHSLLNENSRTLEAIILLLMLLAKKENVSKRESDQVYREIDKKLTELDDYNRDWIEQYVPKASEDGSLLALLALGLLFFKNKPNPTKLEWEQARRDLSVPAVNKALIRLVIDDLTNDMNNVTDNIRRRARQSVREIVADNLRKELAKKKLDTNNAIQNSLVELKAKFGDKVNHVITDSLGRRWKMEHYVKTIVSTKIMDIQNQSSINEGISRGYSLGVITHAPNTIDACRFHQGRTICLDSSVDAPYPTYEELKASGQVFHMNCRHRVYPIGDNFVHDDNQNGSSNAALSAGTRSLKAIEDAVNGAGFNL